MEIGQTNVKKILLNLSEAEKDFITYMPIKNGEFDNCAGSFIFGCSISSVDHMASHVLKKIHNIVPHIYSSAASPVECFSALQDVLRTKLDPSIQTLFQDTSKRLIFQKVLFQAVTKGGLLS